jgi:sortase A
MEALKKGVAHAKGTCFPGMGCRIYFFAHSTNSPFSVSRFNAVFYLLKELEPGDTVFVFYLNQKFAYQVVSKGIYPAEDMEYLVKRGDHEELILQTCDPPGTTLNRLLIFAEN